MRRQDGGTAPITAEDCCHIPLKVRHCHAGSPLRLPGMCSKVAMRSRCSGVSGGNESTTVRTCSARTVARSGIAGSLMLGGGACAVRAGCVRGCGSGPGELLASISGAVAVDRACSALLRVLLALGRCFEWFGLFIRCVFLSPGVVGSFPACLDPASASGRGIRELVGISWHTFLRGSKFRWLSLVRRLPECLL